jgi:20S proteasome subunit beta 4
LLSFTAAMECSIGMVFNDFVMMATDRTSGRSIIVMKDDFDKTYKLSERMLMSVSGESGDTNQFAEYIAKNIQLYKMRNGYELSPRAVTHFTRRNLADSLRSRSPYQVNMLLAGYDPVTDDCQLFFMDYLGSVVEVPYAAHGYGGFFTTAIMDAHYKKGMSREEAYVLMTDCIHEIHKRLIVNLPNFQVQVVDKNGITRMDDITIKKLPVASTTPVASTSSVASTTSVP